MCLLCHSILGFSYVILKLFKTPNYSHRFKDQHNCSVTAEKNTSSSSYVVWPTEEISHWKCNSYELKWSNCLAVYSDEIEENLWAVHWYLMGSGEAAVLVPWWPADPVLMLRAEPFLISLLQGSVTGLCILHSSLIVIMVLSEVYKLWLLW